MHTDQKQTHKWLCLLHSSLLNVLENTVTNLNNYIIWCLVQWKYTNMILHYSNISLQIL